MADSSAARPPGEAVGGTLWPSVGDMSVVVMVWKYIGGVAAAVTPAVWQVPPAAAPPCHGVAVGSPPYFMLSTNVKRRCHLMPENPGWSGSCDHQMNMGLPTMWSSGTKPQ